MAHLTDIREMRKRIDGHAFRGVTMKDGGAPYPNMIANAVLNIARRDGLSGEDAMTMLAYHALYEVERLGRMIIDQVALAPSPSLVFTTSPAITSTQYEAVWNAVRGLGWTTRGQTDEVVDAVVAVLNPLKTVPGLTQEL